MCRLTTHTHSLPGLEPAVSSRQMPVPVQRGRAIRRFAPAALTPAAALAVHQLRYWLAYGNGAAAELQRQGHSYLHSVVPWAVLLLALGAGGFLLNLGRTLGGRCSLPRYTLSFTALWLLCSVCLVTIYCAQELLEGLFAAGHPGGLVGVFGYGGWWSVPAAVAVGLVLSAAFHGARQVLRVAAERCARTATPAARLPKVVWARRDPIRPALAPLANGCSGRGPPI
jgi:hypothetical protein